MFQEMLTRQIFCFSGVIRTEMVLLYLFFLNGGC